MMYGTNHPATDQTYKEPLLPYRKRPEVEEAARLWMSDQLMRGDLPSARETAVYVAQLRDGQLNRAELCASLVLPDR